MYAYFIGRVTEYTVDGIVLEANNVGYNIKVTGETREILASRDGEVKVYTYTYVKEDTLSLFGFLTREELSLFEKMLTVSGIGPKGALAILAALPYDALIYAILTGDAKSISKAQGIGSKTAQRLIIDLKDKISAQALPEIAAGVENAVSGETEAMREAIEACVALGYSNQEAKRAVKEIGEQNLSAEEYVKLALKKLF